MDSKFVALGGVFLIAVVLVGGAVFYFSEGGGMTGKFYAIGEASYESPLVAECSSDQGQTCQKAVDESIFLNSAWVSDYARANYDYNNKFQPQSIVVTLEHRKMVSGVRVWLYSQYVPTVMDVQVSSNNRDWVSVKSDWTAKDYDDPGNELLFDGVVARYIKLVITDVPNQLYTKITEVKVRTQAYREEEKKEEQKHEQ
ncbi:MAG: discoidin domain-containing protein, partial [Anaerolineales bacterium]|nr:discoidin domain-containing protein [Anaerolineales bacterium]